MVISGKHPIEGYEMLTSSGVLVRDGLDLEYMTITAHGFPGFPFSGKVYHPCAGGKEIAEVVMELTHTGIAMVKLHEGVQFQNEPFQNTLRPTPRFNLDRFSRASERPTGGSVFLDSPFSGFTEGRRGATGFIRVPSDNSEPNQNWLKNCWDYMGQGSSSRMPEGLCGSAIWDRNSKLLGFFRYAPKSGRFQDWTMSIAADHLIEGGYTLV